jgi:epoxyqueuosine reductase QueG
MHSNVDRADKVIQEMPKGSWVDVRSLAKRAGLGVRTMSRFLVRARKTGAVEHKRVTLRLNRSYLWRRCS